MGHRSKSPKYTKACKMSQVRLKKKSFKLNFLGSSKDELIRSANSLIERGKEIGLKVNVKKTYMVVAREGVGSNQSILACAGLTFKSTSRFKYESCS